MSRAGLGLGRADNGTRVSLRARWAMILGIAAIPLAFFVAGLVLGVGALVLGIVSRVAIRKDPGHLAGEGFARAGIAAGCCSLVVMPMILALLMPGVGGRRDGGPRAACAANITGIVKGFVFYANEYNDVYPVAGIPAAERAYATDLGTLSKADDPDTALAAVYTTAGAAGNPMTTMWMLVLRQQISPKNMICMGDKRTKITAAPMVDQGGKYYLNPAKADQVSYSIAYPYQSAKEVGGWWKNTTMSDLPVISDMAPLHGTGEPKRDLVPAKGPADVKTVNSGNHGGMGQNVGYADAHCEWLAKPLCGQAGDEIWTVGTKDAAEGGYGGDVIKGGAVPRYPPTKQPPYDTIMVPVRDLDSGAIK